MSLVDRRRPLSLHARILNDIRERIVSGEWPPGTQLPFESELSARYGCSRMTVNKALTQLAAAGLIERRRKAGSFVCRPRSYSAVLTIVDIRDEVEALGLPYHFEVLREARRRSGRADETRLGLAGHVDLLDIACRHFAARQPFCLEERLINLDEVPEAARADFRAVSPGAWLMDEVPWTDAQHAIRAVAADAAASAALLVAAGTPCLMMERRTWFQGRPITVVRLTYPGDGHEVLARFSPAGA